MRLHPREALVQEAEKELLEVLIEWDKRGITRGERIAMLVSAIQTSAKYLIRWERHGDTNKPGGLE